MSAHYGSKCSSKANKSASIGQLFRVELSMMRLFGAILFREHINWYLRVVYKLAAALFFCIFASQVFIVYGRIELKSKPAQQNFYFFWTCQTLISSITLINSCFTSIRNHGLFSILFGKRFDSRYLEGLAASRGATSVRRVVHVPGTRVEEVASSGDGSQMDTEAAFGSTYFRRIPRVRLARILFLGFLSVAALATTYRLDYQQYIRSELQSQFTSVGKIPLKLDSVTATSVGTIWSHNSSSSNATKPPGGYLVRREVGEIVGKLLTLGLQAVDRFARFLLYFLILTPVLLQIYNQIYLTLMVTAALSDILHRVAQELAANSQERLETSPGTTELLVQVRDALIVLRSAVGLNFLLIRLVDMLLQMSFFSLFIAYVAEERGLSVGLLMVDYGLAITNGLIARIGFVWLHAEVRLIGTMVERRYVALSLDLRELRRARIDSKCLDTSNTLASNCDSIRWSRRAKSTRSSGSEQAYRQPISTQRLRIEAFINYRLTKEIEQIWPSDWFSSDLLSYLSQGLFVVTSVISLQQLVEVVDRARRVGTGLVEKTQSDQVGNMT